MPPPIPVVLAPYDPDWPRSASLHAERLRVLGATLAAVHHIGSTSVPGLAAKPIIDLMPLVTDLAGLDRHRQASRRSATAGMASTASPDGAIARSPKPEFAAFTSTSSR